MKNPVSDTEARAVAANRIARIASREVLTAVDQAMVHLDQGPVAHPALLSSVIDRVVLALREAGRGYVDDYFELAATQGRSRRKAAKELGEPMGLGRTGVAGSFGRHTAAASTGE